MTRAEEREDDLDRRLSSIEGKASVPGSIAGAIAGLPGSLITEAVKRGL